ncbi:hypothetical protein [Rhodococcoides fascians]|uniref:hypothetical protein n=1 Tax=Rhodococcoides fascians TaxID=1828 RepID=UPI0012D310E7|nr:hypothetical protein [Rhodococcus fascians]
MNVWDEQEKYRNVISAAILDALASGHPADIAAHVESKLAENGYRIARTNE